jgi:hypothetical protein
MLRSSTILLAFLASPALALDPAPTTHLEHMAQAGREGLGAVVAQFSPSPQRRAAEATPRSTSTARRRATKNPRILAERMGYKRVSSLVNFPAFFPGIGVVFVRPETLPLGPFLAFDRRDRLISTIYMVPLDQMNEHRKFDAGGTAPARVDHVTIYYNGGHPGVDVPHYHVHLWHVSKKNEALVAR